MSEATIQTGLQTLIKAMSGFADADVTINDWDILDQPKLNAPYVIIENADDFNSGIAPSNDAATWSVKLNLIVSFKDYKTTYDSFRLYRQALLDALNDGNARSAGGLDGVIVNEIRAGTDIAPLYPPVVSNDEFVNIDPDYIMQVIICDVEEF